ncbi:MAG: class II glutamine amidotransferase [Gammaproteobacteria bacterium]|nr:class II glutamine amidotransferase [Gammaproteobacteria bacterium]
MCRFVAYLGREMLLEQVLVKPENSLVRQSICAREQSSEVPNNGDGFGLGWYVPTVDEFPAQFRSIFPAWSDNNLLSLTSKISSPCFFGHVRAATTGGINPYNCHPFIYKRWMLMHNGEISGFPLLKRHLRKLLDDEYYDMIQGETDSEHLFAFFLQHAKGKKMDDINEVASVMRETIAAIEKLVKTHGDGGVSYINLCLTDGLQMLAVRYCTHVKELESLHYIVGANTNAEIWKSKEEQQQRPTFVLVASEKLTHWTGDWKVVPGNHFLLIDAYRDVKLEKI